MIPSPIVNLGGFSFHAWNGWVPGSQSEVDSYYRPGDTTDGMQVIATRGRVVACKAMTMFGNYVDATTFADDIEAAQGSSLQIVDQWASSYTVQVVSVQARPKSGGGEAPFRVEVDISLRYVGII